MILLSELLDKKLNENTLSGKDNPTQVLVHISDLLNKYDDVTIDLSNMRSLSPSFAYEAIGKLFDEFGTQLLNRLHFVNDPLDLQSRIIDAVKRRENILKHS